MPRKRANLRRPKASGRVRQLSSGRWQARFQAPEGHPQAGRLYPAPQTFDTKGDAEKWLGAQVQDARAEAWEPPEPGASTRPRLTDYAEVYLAVRPLRPRVEVEYRGLLDRAILPSLGDRRIDRIEPSHVTAWYAALPAEKPRARAQAYALLKAILNLAVANDLIVKNPCRVPKASTTKRKREPIPATLGEVQVIHDAMPERYRAMVSLAAFCAVRFGELTELRRKDLDLKAGRVHVRRGVTKVKGEFVVGPPKSDAGVREVAIPPHLLKELRAHLRKFVDLDPEALLFPARQGGHMAPSSLNTVFDRARIKAGRGDLRWHDLRHTGATLAGSMGATVAELKARLGHSTTHAAMQYQHATKDRDASIAALMSERVLAEAIPITRARRKA
jgi:integrase